MHPQIILIEENDHVFHRFDGPTKLLQINAVEKLSGSRIYGFKAPRDTHRYLEFHELMEPLTFFWIRRNILDVVSSMTCLGKEISWAKQFAPREIKKFIERFCDYTQIAKHYRLANRINGQRQKELTMGSLCWIVKEISRLGCHQAFPDKTTTVQYEALVTDPECEVRKVLEQLELEWIPDMIRFCVKRNQKPLPGGASYSRPIDRASVGKGKALLTCYEKSLVCDLVDSFQPHFEANNEGAFAFR